MTVCIRYTVVLLLLMMNSGLLTSQVSISSDRENSSYEIGESVIFSVEGPANSEASYVLFYDQVTDQITTGTLNLNADGDGSISFSPQEPGVIFCEVEVNEEKATEAVQFSFDLIEPFEEEPDDWDAFWTSQKALHESLPMDPELTFLDSTEFTATYRINLAHIDNRRVYGYITIPAGEGPFPAIITFPSFGSSAGVVDPQWAIAERGGAISVAINIHNAEPDEEDPNAYLPDDFDTKEGNYFRYPLLGAVRMIDYLYTRSDFDGQNVGVMGKSQGGGLAVLLAGIDNRINLLASGKNILAEHAAYKYGRASGFPQYLRKSNALFGTIEHETATLEASKYYDAVYAARRYEGPSLLTLGYQDLTSPAATIMACYNQFKGPSILFHETNSAHSQSSGVYTNGRYDFFRRYYPSMQSPPWPWPDEEQGYYINAGEDLNVTLDDTIILNGIIMLEQNLNPEDFNPEWNLVQGPGDVIFSNPNSYSTDISFSESGTYLFRFSGKDESMFEETQGYFSFSDYMEVIVEEPLTSNVISPDNNSFIQIVPNPATSKIELVGLENIFSEEVYIEFFDSKGALVKIIKQHATTKNSINLNHLSKGLYLVKISDKNSNQYIIKRLIHQ